MTEQEHFLRRAMEAHGPAVYRMALCRTQSVPDAQDVYQDVFLRLLGQAAAPEWAPEHLKAWLLRTALNRCADLHRLRLRRPVVPLEEVAETAAAEDGAAELLCRGLLHPGDRPAAGSSGGHDPHPAPPGPPDIKEFAGRR